MASATTPATTATSRSASPRPATRARAAVAMTRSTSRCRRTRPTSRWAAIPTRAPSGSTRTKVRVLRRRNGRNQRLPARLTGVLILLGCQPSLHEYALLRPGRAVQGRCTERLAHSSMSRQRGRQECRPRLFMPTGARPGPGPEDRASRAPDRNNAAGKTRRAGHGSP